MLCRVRMSTFVLVICISTSVYVYIRVLVICISTSVCGFCFLDALQIYINTRSSTHVAHSVIAISVQRLYQVALQTTQQDGDFPLCNNHVHRST